MRAFRLPHALHTGESLSKSLGISHILLSLGFGILWVVGLIERALLLYVIFLDLFLFVGLLKNNIQLLNAAQRLSM
jgi:hypothetical protein